MILKRFVDTIGHIVTILFINDSQHGKTCLSAV